MEVLQFIITSVVIPVLLAFLTGGLGIVVYNSRQDKKNKIAAQPVEAKKLELDATDRAIKNILVVQDQVLEENSRLSGRINELELRLVKSQEDSDEKFKEMQELLDEALRKVEAYRRYLQKVRRELYKQDIQMPEPDPRDAGIINL
jgi:hypothetical protein